MLNLFALFLLPALVHAAPQPVTSLPTAAPSWLRFLGTVANFALAPTDSSPPKEANSIYNIQPRDDSATTESVQSSLLATTISSFSSLPFVTPSPTSSFITNISSSPAIPSQCLPQSPNVSIPVSTVPVSNITTITIPTYTLPTQFTTLEPTATATNETIYNCSLPATTITIVPTTTSIVSNATSTGNDTIPTITCIVSNATSTYNDTIPTITGIVSNATSTYNDTIPILTVFNSSLLPTATATSTIVSNGTSTDNNTIPTITITTLFFPPTATVTATLNSTFSDPCAIYSSAFTTSFNFSALASSATPVTVSTFTTVLPVPSQVNSSD